MWSQEEDCGLPDDDECSHAGDGGLISLGLSATWVVRITRIIRLVRVV